MEGCPARLYTGCQQRRRQPARLHTAGETAIFIVITGGPSVGKTTIISQLRERQYRVIDEMATQIIKEGQILPWIDRDGFQKEVLRRQLEAEATHAGETQPVFLDRGLFDGEAYYVCDGLPVPQVFTSLPPTRYKLALLIEALPFFDSNGVRFEDLEFTKRISPVIEDCYKRRGVPVEHIPALPPEQRIDYVLQVIAKHIARVTVAPAALPTPAVAVI